MDHVRDEEKHEEEPVSDANTMVGQEDRRPEQEEHAQEDANPARLTKTRSTMPEEQLNPEDYPKGAQFIFILLALILSIFMVALDLVGLSL